MCPSPRDVTAQLKHTALAEADQRQAAVEAVAQGDQATATVLRSLAELLGQQKAALEAQHAEHENWSATTARLREKVPKLIVRARFPVIRSSARVSRSKRKGPDRPVI